MAAPPTLERSDLGAPGAGRSGAHTDRVRPDRRTAEERGGRSNSMGQKFRAHGVHHKTAAVSRGRPCEDLAAGTGTGTATVTQTDEKRRHHALLETRHDSTPDRTPDPDRTAGAAQCAARDSTAGSDCGAGPTDERRQRRGSGPGAYSAAAGRRCRGRCERGGDRAGTSGCGRTAGRNSSCDLESTINRSAQNSR